MEDEDLRDRLLSDLFKDRPCAAGEPVQEYARAKKVVEVFWLCILLMSILGPYMGDRFEAGNCIMRAAETKNTGNKMKHCKILVIEDSNLDFQVIEKLLRAKIPAATIARAHDFASSRIQMKKRFDIVLLDLNLPDISGQPLLAAIGAIMPLQNVIILTGSNDLDFSIRSIGQGVSDYLLKEGLGADALYRSICHARERNRMARLHQEAEKRYSDMFRLCPQPMWVYDIRTLRFLQFNDAAVRNYGYAAEEFLGMTLRDIRPEEELASLHKALGMLEGQRVRFSSPEIFVHRRKDGSVFFVEIISNIIIIGRRRCEVVLATDVSLRQKHIEAIESQNRRLREIAFQQSHVVRAPLANLMGILGVLEDTDPSSEAARELLVCLGDSARKLDGIISAIAKNCESYGI